MSDKEWKHAMIWHTDAAERRALEREREARRIEPKVLSEVRHKRPRWTGSACGEVTK